MGEDGKVIYRVVIDDNGVESEAEAAGHKAGSGVERGATPGTSAFREMMIGAARAIGEAFVRMAQEAIQGVEQIARAGIEFNAKMEKYQTGLTTLLGSEEEAARVMEQIRKDAASTPFDVDSLTQANQMLISTGLSADTARDDVLNLANAIAATGGGSAELSRMAANMQQVKNVGKATAMDIRQFAMAGINIYQLLADATGKTTAEVQDMEVSYELLSLALSKAADEGGAYYGAMEAQAQTFNGRLSTLKDNAMQLAGALTSDLFNQLSGGTLPMVMDWVATLLEAAQTGGIDGAINAAKAIMTNLFQQFRAALPEALQAGMELIISLINGIADKAPVAMDTIRDILFLLLNTITNNLPALVSAGVNLLTSLVRGLLSALPDIHSAGMTLLKTLIDEIIAHGPELLTNGILLILELAKGFIEAIPDLLTMLGHVIVGILNAFAEADWTVIGAEIVNGIWAGFVGLWDWLVGQITSSLDALWNWAKHILGIASPSKKFKYIGEMSVEGIEEGFEEGEQDLTKTVTHVTAGMLEAATGVSGVGDSMERSVSYNLAASTGATTIVVPLSIDGREVARATAWSMGEQLAWEEM